MITALIWFLGIVYFLACGWLVIVILLQEGKSGGMSSADSVSQGPAALSDTFGAGGAQKGLYNITAWTAALFFALALGLTILGNVKEQQGGNLNLDGGIVTPPVAGTVAPSEAPVGGSAPATTQAPAAE